MPLQGSGCPHEKDHDLTALCFTVACMKVTLHQYLQESPAYKIAHPAVSSEHILSPRSILNVFCPPSPHQHLSFPSLCFQQYLLVLLLTSTCGVRRHWTQPVCPSCSATKKQRFGKLICFPWHPFSAQRDSHRGTGQLAWNWVEKHRIYSKLVDLFFRHFPEIHLSSFFWNYTFAFEDCTPLLITV